MQVNSVSATSFGNNAQKIKLLEGFASLDDKAIKEIAYKEAYKDTGMKANRIASNAMWASVPALAGLATLTALKGAKGSRAAKVLAGLATVGSWAGTFAIMDSVGAIKGKINKHSEAARNFDSKHPFLSFVGIMGAAIGAVVLAGKGLKLGGSKLLPKVIKKFPRAAVKLRRGFVNLAGKINNSKFITNTIEKASKLPKPVKSVLKYAGRNLHWAVALSAMVNSMVGNSKLNRAYAGNYVNLKNAQNEARVILDNVANTQGEEA